MARVANCPQCSHEILITDDGEYGGWAQCPECHAFFQIQDAGAREVQPAEMIDDLPESGDEPSAIDSDETLFAGDTMAAAETMLEPVTDKSRHTITDAHTPTVSDFPPAGARWLPEDDEPVVDSASDIPANIEPEDEAAHDAGESHHPEWSAATVDDLPSRATWSGDAQDYNEQELNEAEPAADIDIEDSSQQAVEPSAEDAEESVDRIDKWFQEGTSPAETPTVDMESEIESAIEHTNINAQPAAEYVEDSDTPAWDDSAHMDRLLADVEDSETHEFEPELPADEPAALDEADEPIGLEEVGEPMALEETETAEELHEEHEEAEQPQDEPSSAHSQAAEGPPFFIPPGRLPRRKKSVARMVGMLATSAVVGLGLGYYALLWIAGPDADFLHFAHWLPAAMLPGEFRPTIARRVTTDSVAHTTEKPSTDTEQPSTDAGANAPDERPEQQASFTAPAERNNVEGTTTGDKYDVTTSTNPQETSPTENEQPLPFDAGGAAPLANTHEPPAGGVADAPTFSADELALALKTAQDAQPKLVAGSLTDGREAQLAKGFSFSLFCDLAQKAAFVNLNDRTEYANALEGEADQLFRETLANEHTRDEVAMILPKWIGSPHRKHGGVFFGGTVIGDTKQGTVVECQFNLGAQKTVTVLVPLALAEQLASAAGPIGVVGSIVNRPAEKINGYTGSAANAIWAARLIPLQ